MEEIDRLIQKYDEAKQALTEYEKKVQKYKERIEKYCKDNKIDNYENGSYWVKKQTQTRNAMIKKSVPEDIWNKYCTISKIEFFTMRKKTEKPHRVKTDESS